MQAGVETLIAAGVTRIIVRRHSGYGVDQKVASGITGVVDVVGHSNPCLSNTSDKAEGSCQTMVGATAMVSACAYGKFPGKINVTFKDAGEVVTASVEPLIIHAVVAGDVPTLLRIAELPLGRCV